jgi:hypothetical protein
MRIKRRLADVGNLADDQYREQRRPAALPRASVTYSVRRTLEDQGKCTLETNMSFELIMLLGFFGAALLPLLPATPRRVAGDRWHRQLRLRSNSRRADGEGKNSDRASRCEQPTQGRSVAGIAA